MEAQSAERDGAGRLAVAAELDLLDLRLSRLKPGLALLAQTIPFAVKLDRLVQRCLAAFEPADDLLQTLQSGFEGEFGDRFGLFGHWRSNEPGDARNQPAAGFQASG